MNLPAVRMPAGFNAAGAFHRAATAHTEGRLGAAEQLYRAILKQDPKHFETLSNLGFLLTVTERAEEAAHLLRKALNQRPRSAVAQCLLARALLGHDRQAEAMERIERALALDPRLADAHATQAQAFAELGRYAEAIQAIDRAIALRPGHPGYYFFYGQIARWTAGDPRLAALRALEGTSGLAERIDLEFALAKADADLGDPEASFRHQIAGGALQRRLVPYNETEELRTMTELAETIGASWLGRMRGHGAGSVLPVFIVGMPRSGTSLLEQILASHPAVHAFGERADFGAAVAELCGTPVLPADLARRAAAWPGSHAGRLGGRYLDRMRRDMPAGAARFVDKLPSNFLLAGLIHAALPDARIIHARRDPIDTCLSMFSVLFGGPGHSYSYDLGELGRYYRAYERLMVHWRAVLPPEVLLEVRYEDVVDDLEGQARRAVAHCGLDWDDSCLAFHRTERPVRTASHAQVRQPIYRSAIGRPRPPPEMMRPLLDALGPEQRQEGRHGTSPR